MSRKNLLGLTLCMWYNYYHFYINKWFINIYPRDLFKDHVVTVNK